MLGRRGLLGMAAATAGLMASSGQGQASIPVLPANAELLLLSRLDRFNDKIDQVWPDANKCSVLCVPIAAQYQDDYAWIEGEIAPLKQRARLFQEFDLRRKGPAEIDKALAGADIVYLPGGNTYFALHHLKKSRFSESLTRAFNHGVRYLGTSAGAIVTCPEVDFIGDLDDRSIAELDDCNGMGLVDFNVLPHLDHPDYAPKVRAIAESLIGSKRNVICLRDDQGVHVRGRCCQIF